MSETEARAAKLHVGFPSLLKKSCLSENDPVVVIGSCGKIRAMSRIHLVVFVLVSGLLGCQSQNSDEAAIERMVAETQARSSDGAKPVWLKWTDKPELFIRARDRGYVYCLANGRIDEICAAKQDEAISSSVLAIHLSSGQAKMQDMGTLSVKERWVALNPEIAPRVTRECWELYNEHGGEDARILSVCLGNLTDYSPLIPVPVAD